MIPSYCPRCGKPLLPDARQLPVLWPGDPSVGKRDGAPHVPTRAAAMIIAVLLFMVVPIAILMATAPRLIDDLRDLSSFPPRFPPDFPFPSSVP